jgi:hypothetical protein
MGGDQISVRRHGRREIITYDVTPDQLDRMERAGADLGFNFHIALFLLTLAISFLTSLVLTPPTPGIVQTVFIVITVLGFLFGPIFGYKWLKDRKAHASIFREVREQPEIGPLGDEKQELRPSELHALPVEPAPSNPGMKDSVKLEVSPVVSPEGDPK